jgi:hypothetical protein
MKNSSYTRGNRTRDLLACSTMPQPTAPPRTPRVKLQSWQSQLTEHASNIPGQVRTTSRSWDKGVLTDLCLTLYCDARSAKH